MNTTIHNILGSISLIGSLVLLLIGAKLEAIYLLGIAIVNIVLSKKNEI